MSFIPQLGNKGMEMKYEDEADKISVELTHTEILVVAGDHFQSANAYWNAAKKEPEFAEAYDLAGQEHWERAEELTALVPDDTEPLTPEQEALVAEAIAREVARQCGVPANKEFIHRLMSRPPQGEN